MVTSVSDHYTKVAIEPLKKIDQSLFAIGLLGALVFSQLTIFSLLFGIFSSELFMFIKCLATLYFAYWCYQERKRFHMPEISSMLVIGLVLVLILIVTSASLETPIPHGDARQYHLALPWHFSLKNGIFIEPSLRQTGMYLGYDVFYLLLGDISSLIDNPSLMVSLKIFSASSPILLLAGTYSLGRPYGLDRFWRFGSATAVMAMGSVSCWGSLKNDLVVAGVALFVVVQLQKAWHSRRTSDLYWSVALGAFAVSIKVSILVPLAIPFLAVLLSCKFSFRTLAQCFLLALLLLSPWFVYSLFPQSNPIYPLAVALPPEIESAWSSRNANGLERSIGEASTQFFSILLGTYRISGNHTVGVLFVSALFICLAGLFLRMSRRLMDIRDVILIGAVLWFLIFYYMRFDGRFLSRYIVYCGSVFYVYAGFLFFNLLAGLKKWKAAVYILLSSGLAALVLFLVWSSPFTKSRISAADKVLGLGVSGWSREWHGAYTEWTDFHRKVNDLAAGNGVAVNDHFILFINGPVLNLHAMHAVNLNLYNKDYLFVRDLLAEKGIETLVVRRGISGMTNALEDYIKNCAERVEGSDDRQSSREVYRTRSDCS